jgi:hypothetical protein
MRSLPLIAAVLLTFTIFTAVASTATQPNNPLILLFNSDKIYSTGYLIISGQASPNESIIIHVQNFNQSTTQTLEAVSDSDGHFKVDFITSEHLAPGLYTVKATTRTSTATNAFTVEDESTQLCSELEQIVQRTRSEAEAVYNMLTPITLLATEMNASIQEGNSLYEEAQNQQKEKEINSAIEAYRAALLAYGEALHTKELMSSSKQPSPEAIMIMELLEKIRRLKDTVTDITNQTSQGPPPLDTAKNLIVTAEKLLSENDFQNLQWTLEKLVETMEVANTETQSISSSITLSKLIITYNELYTRVLKLDEELNTKLPSKPPAYPIIFDYIEKLKDKFELIAWMEAVSVGKPYIPEKPIEKPVDKKRIQLLETEISEAEIRIRKQAETEHNTSTLNTIYKAWDLLKNAKLSLLSGNVDYAESLLIESRTVMEFLR